MTSLVKSRVSEPVVITDGKRFIKKNCIGSLKDEVLLSITRHCLQIVDKLPGILVNSVLLARREVESWLETFPRIPLSPEVEQAETGEDTEGGDDDVTVFAGSLQTSVKINQKAVAGPDGGRWDQMKRKSGFKRKYKPPA